MQFQINLGMNIENRLLLDIHRPLLGLKTDCSDGKGYMDKPNKLLKMF